MVCYGISGPGGDSLSIKKSKGADLSISGLSASFTTKKTDSQIASDGLREAFNKMHAKNHGSTSSASQSSSDTSVSEDELKSLYTLADIAEYFAKKADPAHKKSAVARAKKLRAQQDKIDALRHNGMSKAEAKAKYEEIRNKYSKYLAAWVPDKQMVVGQDENGNNLYGAMKLKIDENKLEQVIKRYGGPETLNLYIKAREAISVIKAKEHEIYSQG